MSLNAILSVFIKQKQKITQTRTSLVVQWLRIHLPSQGRSHVSQSNQVHEPQLLRVRSRAHEPHVLRVQFRAHEPQLLKPTHPRAGASTDERSRHTEKPHTTTRM